MTMNTAMDAYRVLDLTDDKGFFCAKILGDLGADVLKIERPGGDPARKAGPFYKDDPDPEKNLNWFAYNLNKRGITLDIEKEAGRALFKKLVERADFVIESFPVGYLEGLGLGYKTLSALRPRLILTSISPFGQTGPYKDYVGSDLIGMAMGGLAYITGNAGESPVRISFPQAYLLASAEAAAATMIAHYHR
jgi:benzylsuccinate CoA-transferase BbsE subunit